MVKIDASQMFSDPTDVTLKNGKITLEGSLSKTRQLAFYRIKFSQRSNLSLALTDLSDNLDLALYRPNRDQVTDSTNNHDSDESISRLRDSGTYIVRINRIDGNTDYKLNISATPDAGTGFFQGLRIKPKSGGTEPTGKYTFRDFVGIPNGSSTRDEHPDYYRFNLTSTTTFTGRLEGLEKNADLGLYNSKRKPIAVSAKGGTATESVSRTLQPGLYFIKVNPRSDGRTKYRLKLSFQPST